MKVGYRYQVNSRTIPDFQPIPRIHNVLAANLVPVDQISFIFSLEEGRVQGCLVPFDGSQ